MNFFQDKEKYIQCNNTICYLMLIQNNTYPKQKQKTQFCYTEKKMSNSIRKGTQERTNQTEKKKLGAPVATREWPPDSRYEITILEWHTNIKNKKIKQTNITTFSMRNNQLNTVH